jgi:hypothetical protein
MAIRAPEGKEEIKTGKPRRRTDGFKKDVTVSKIS